MHSFLSTEKLSLFFLLLVFVVFCGSSSLTNTNHCNSIKEEQAGARRSGLVNALEVFKQDPALKNASWGFAAIEVETGRRVALHNEHLALVPASALKLVATASALLLLGPTYQYETLLGYTGMVDHNGVLKGDLVIKGSGDPTLGSAALHDSLSLTSLYDTWFNDLKKKGIKRIEGRVIADESAFDMELIPRKWLWEDFGNYFGAGSSGLTVNENMYTVFFQPGQAVGQPARVLSTDPVVPGMTFVNQVTTGARNSGDQVYILGAPYQMERTLTGTVPLGSNNFVVRGSIPDPPLFVAQTFDKFLSDNGIKVVHPATTQRLRAQLGLEPPLFSGLVSSRISPILASITTRTNFRSVNTLAENLLKTIGLQLKGEGSTKKGIDAIMDLWKQNGLDTDGLFLHDGSGLSPSNRITTWHLVNVILQTLKGDVGVFFAEGLPIAGKSGNLVNFFKGTASEDVLRAKSGFLSGARAYAGYTTNREGKIIAFALIVNNFGGSNAAMRDKMFVLLDAITSN